MQIDDLSSYGSFGRKYFHVAFSFLNHPASKFQRYCQEKNCNKSLLHLVGFNPNK